MTPITIAFIAGYAAATLCWICFTKLLARIQRIRANRRKIQYLTPRLVLENRTRNKRKKSALSDDFWNCPTVHLTAEDFRPNFSKQATGGANA